MKLVARNDDDHFELALHEKIALTHDTYKLVFKLPEDNHVVGLNVCGHLIFHIPDGDDYVSRKYTPVSSVNERGKVEFVIKIYRSNDEFPSGGKMSQYLESL